MEQSCTLLALDRSVQNDKNADERGWACPFEGKPVQPQPRYRRAGVLRKQPPTALGQMPGAQFSAAGELAETARWPLFLFTYSHQ